MGIDDDNGAGTPASLRDVPMIDLGMTRDEALMHYTLRERALIGRLEEIATGTAGASDSTDLEIVRGIARDALEDLGWPVVKQWPDIK